MNDFAARKAKKGLGRGLSALISTQPISIPDASQKDRTAETVPDTEGVDSGICYINPADIMANPEQPRKEFDQTELQELSESIKSLGVLQPILVRPVEASNGKYEIIAGERRWRASQLAGLSQLPVMIRDFSDRETMEAALVENIQRSELTPIEEARAYQLIMEQHNLSQQSLAERVGKDRATISNYVRLLKLPEEVLKLLEDGYLSMGHAKAILTVKEPAAQKNLARKVLDEKLSVRALEDIVSRVVVLKNDKKKPKSINKNKTAFPEVVDRLRQSLGTKVHISHSDKDGRGKIEIQYFSEEELDRLVEQLV